MMKRYITFLLSIMIMVQSSPVQASFDWYALKNAGVSAITALYKRVSANKYVMYGAAALGLIGLSSMAYSYAAKVVKKRNKKPDFTVHEACALCVDRSRIVDEYKKTIENLKNKLREQEDARQDLEQNAVTNTKHKEELLKKLAKKETEIKELEEKCEDLKKQCESTANLAAQHIAESSNLEKQMQENKTNNNVFNGQIVALQNRCNDLIATNEQLSEYLSNIKRYAWNIMEEDRPGNSIVKIATKTIATTKKTVNKVPNKPRLLVCVDVLPAMLRKSTFEYQNVLTALAEKMASEGTTRVDIVWLTCASNGVKELPVNLAESLGSQFGNIDEYGDITLITHGFGFSIAADTFKRVNKKVSRGIFIVPPFERTLDGIVVPENHKWNANDAQKIAQESYVFYGESKGSICLGHYASIKIDDEKLNALHDDNNATVKKIAGQTVIHGYDVHIINQYEAYAHNQVRDYVMSRLSELLKEVQAINSSQVDVALQTPIIQPRGVLVLRLLAEKQKATISEEEEIPTIIGWSFFN